MLDLLLVCKQSMQIVCIWSVCCVQLVCTSLANSPFTLLSECLQTVCSMCACINHGQVRMDYVFFIPPPPFFEGTRVEFADPTIQDCWYGRVALLCRIRVKLDKKDGDGRSVRMDCDCAMIECLYDFAPGRCACASCFWCA